MRYTLSNDNFNDFYCFEDNALSPRAYFVPFKSMGDACKTTYLNERYSSSLVEILNGKWDFIFYDRISKMPLEIDTDEMQFDTVKVPGCWQYQGYEAPFYINTRYMFDIKKMPLVPADKGYYGKDAERRERSGSFQQRRHVSQNFQNQKDQEKHNHVFGSKFLFAALRQRFLRGLWRRQPQYS